MTTRIHGIDWDTDGAEVDLPEEVVIDLEAEGIEDPETEVADWLSDHYGYCVHGFLVDRDHEPTAPQM